jgi:hypothetical protein
MGNPNILPSQRAAIVATIDPALVSSAVLSDYIDASKFENFMAVVSVGALGNGATVDAKLRQATDSSGTGVKDITGKAATQLTDAGTDDNKQVIINVSASELDIANSFTHIVLSVTGSAKTAAVATFEIETALPTEGDTVTITDEDGDEIVFEFVDAAENVTGTNTAVLIDDDVDLATAIAATQANLATAIGTTDLKVTATSDAAVLTVTSDGTGADADSLLIEADLTATAVADIDVTLGNGASQVSAVVYGFDPKYGPASDNDLASVDEIIE